MSEPLQKLVRAARNHDYSAWDELFRMFQLRLLAYAHGVVGEREAALDIVQETFIRAVAHVGTLRDDGKFGAWLLGIAHQRCVAHFRKTRRERELRSDGADVGLLMDEGSDPFALLIAEECSAEILGLVDAMPVAQRSALLLHVLGECSLEEIAVIAGVPLGTVKSRLHHAKRALRGRIARDDP